MKNFALKLSTVVIIILVAIIVYLRECTTGVYDVPEDHTLVHDTTWQKFTEAATAAPDTVYRDTGTTHIIVEYRDRPVPVPVAVEPDINRYRDSTLTDTFKFWIEADIRGSLDRWDWWFDITRQVITNTVEIPAPYPVEVPVPLSQAGWYVSLGLGGTHTGKPAAGLGLDYITKEERLYGAQYTRIGSDNFYMFRLGTRIGRNR